MSVTQPVNNTDKLLQKGDVARVCTCVVASGIINPLKVCYSHTVSTHTAHNISLTRQERFLQFLFTSAGRRVLLSYGKDRINHGGETQNNVGHDASHVTLMDKFRGQKIKEMDLITSLFWFNHLVSRSTVATRNKPYPRGLRFQ